MQLEINNNVDHVGHFQLLKFFQIDGVLKLKEPPTKSYHHKTWSLVVTSTWDAPEDNLELPGTSCANMVSFPILVILTHLEKVILDLVIGKNVPPKVKLGHQKHPHTTVLSPLLMQSKLKSMPTDQFKLVSLFMKISCLIKVEFMSIRLVPLLVVMLSKLLVGEKLMLV